ncbi:hypothetical protein B296_00050318 [Ensete ventricosum]|uniref:Uncharacterized protein n=1 Tax=Ensete ventricosum TaxID=4639 RepID=A0A426YLS5_ENSVE|nr:hypothetical protein B296_00050318 [Ensete ventricosum]
MYMHFIYLIICVVSIISGILVISLAKILMMFFLLSLVVIHVGFGFCNGVVSIDDNLSSILFLLAVFIFSLCFESTI